MILSGLSCEWVRVAVTGREKGVPADVHGAAVYLALVPPGTVPDADDWIDAEWEFDGDRNYARVLFGDPDGDVELAAGDWEVWVKFGANPETPIDAVDSLSVTSPSRFKKHRPVPAPTARLPRRTKYGARGDASFMVFTAGPKQSLTDAECAAQAAYFDVLFPNIAGTNVASVRPWSQSQLAAMRAQNPDLLVIGYLLQGAIEQQKPLAAGYDQNHPPGVYVFDQEAVPTDQAGLDAHASKTGGGNYIMRLWEQGWRSFLVARYKQKVEAYGADGALMDVGGRYPATEYSVPQPWDYFRHVLGWRIVDWLAQSRDVVTLVGHSLGSDAKGVARSMWVNGIDHGTAYFGNDVDPAAPTRMIFDDVIGQAGGMVENFLRADSAAVDHWPPVDGWLANIDMMVYAHALGLPLFCLTKLWPASGPATVAQSKQWHKASRATFRLGDNGGNAWQFRHDNKNLPYDANDTMKGRHHQFASNYYGPGDVWWDREDLGDPTEFFTTADDDLTGRMPSVQARHGAGPYYYSRQFQRGIVLLNPNAVAIPNVALPAGNYRDMDGALYSGSLTLDAHSGYVLSQI